MLEVLVGKTIEQAVFEVLEEDELAAIRARQRALDELKMAEIVEQQRLEEQERRHQQEKVRLHCHFSLKPLHHFSSKYETAMLSSTNTTFVLAECDQRGT